MSERVSVQQVQRAVQSEVQEDEDDGFHRLLINASAGRAGGGVHLLQSSFRCHLRVVIILSIEYQIPLYIYSFSERNRSFPDAFYDARGCLLGARLGVKENEREYEAFSPPPRSYEFSPYILLTQCDIFCISSFFF